jgi:hypothetical protein
VTGYEYMGYIENKTLCENNGNREVEEYYIILIQGYNRSLF